MKNKLAYFLFLLFGIGWTFMTLGLLPGDNEVYAALINFYAYVPLLSVWIVCGFHMSEKETGIHWRFSKKAKAKDFYRAWYLPILLVLAGGAIYYLVKPGSFDITASRLVENYAGQNVPGWLAVVMQIATDAITRTAFQCLPSLGQEVGWVGWLQPQLEKKMSPEKAMLLTGLLRGVWYLPVICFSGLVFGTGYAGEPWTGLLTITLYMIFLNILVTLVYQRTGSILAATLCRATFEAFGIVPTYFLKEVSTSMLLGPGLPGLISMIPMAAASVLLYRKAKKQPQ